MKIVPLSRQSVLTIHRAVETVFSRIKSRVLGPDYLSAREQKMITFGHREHFSIPGIYHRAAAEEGTKANDAALDGFSRITEAYLDSERERAKARVVGVVDSWLRDAYSKKIKTNLETVLDGELARVWGQVTSEVNKIVDSQATTARNLGTLEGITKVNAASGISDPTMFFIIVRDGLACEECTRLHLLPDKVTPRVWKLSEVSAGFHKRGEESPSMCGLHPACRCIYDRYAPVITERGIVPISEVLVGDRVLTHTGTFKAVTATFGADGISKRPEDGLFRIEFKSPQGRTHKLRVTGDHLMMTQRGWVRGDSLRSGDSLQYLHQTCLHCGESFPHNIRKTYKQFCSLECANKFKVGKMADITRVSQNFTGGYSFRPVEIERVVHVPASKVSRGARLYDLTVEDDESFVVMGVVSHNCAVATLMPGYGFNAAGKIAYISPGWDEYKNQRG